MSLRKKVISSVKWIILLRYTTRALDFLKYAIITRVLIQSEVGNFVLATTILITFEALSDTGFTFAFIQKRASIAQYAKTLWVISIVRGAAISLLIVISAGFFTWFFHAPELFSLLLIASVIPVIKGFQSPYVIQYQRNLEFHKEFAYRLVPLLMSSIASIGFVLVFKNAFSLMFAIVLGALSETLFSFLITKTTFSHPFNFNLVKKLFHYGKYLTAGSIFTLLMTQLDTLFVGKAFGSSMLAIYDLSFKLANIVFSEITDMISRVAFPYFSRVQKDKVRLKHAFILNIKTVSLPAIFATGVFIFFPKEILSIAFGAKYASGAQLLQILSIYGLLRAIAGPLGPLFLSIGKPSITTKANIANFALLSLLLYPLSILFGLNGAALSMTVSYLLILPYLLLHFYYVFKNKGS